jgi:hypothetical protein
VCLSQIRLQAWPHRKPASVLISSVLFGAFHLINLANSRFSLLYIVLQV